MNHISFTLKTGEIVLIDKDDYQRVTEHNWQLNSTGYVRRSSVNSDGFLKRKTILLHRFLLGFPNCEIDHINRNKLDNRRCNLRLSNRFQNSFNKEIFGSIDYCKKSKMYSARAAITKHRINFGSFIQKRKAELVISRFYKYLNGDSSYYNYIIKHLKYRLTKPSNRRVLENCLRNIEFIEKFDIKLLTSVKK